MRSGLTMAADGGPKAIPILDNGTRQMLSGIIPWEGYWMDHSRYAFSMRDATTRIRGITVRMKSLESRPGLFCGRVSRREESVFDAVAEDDHFCF